VVCIIYIIYSIKRKTKHDGGDSVKAPLPLYNDAFMLFTKLRFKKKFSKFS